MKEALVDPNGFYAGWMSWFAHAPADSLEGVDVHAELLTGDDVVGTLVSETADYDVTIIGATRESLLDQLVFGAIPEEVGRRADSTVIMAKRNLGLRSRLSRWVR